MAKKHSTRAVARKNAEVRADRRQAAEAAQEKLYALREEAYKTLSKPEEPRNPLIDGLGPVSTLEKIRAVTAFLEFTELVDDQTTHEAEEGRWLIQQWLNRALEYTQAQVEHEKEINSAVMLRLQASEARS